MRVATRHAQCLSHSLQACWHSCTARPVAELTSIPAGLQQIFADAGLSYRAASLIILGIIIPLSQVCSPRTWLHTVGDSFSWLGTKQLCHKATLGFFFRRNGNSP